MSAQARILVVGNDSEVLTSIAAVVQPLGYLLLHAASLDELATRLRDLRPELVIVDADAAVSRDVERIADVFQGVLAETGRPQLLLLARVDDSLRQKLLTAVRADDLIDKPFDNLDMQVRVRSLVRVHRLTAQALRDRDLLNALFELTTFNQAYANTDQVLMALAGRVAEWSGLAHVVVTLGPASQPRVAAEQHSKGSASSKGGSLVDRRHAELINRGEMLLLDEADGVLAGESPATLPYVGLPLRSQNGEVLGVLHAWGQSGTQHTASLPSGPHLRVLRVAAERISTEIQLHASNRRLEEKVEARTADLTAALDRLRGVNAQLLESSRDTVMRLARAAEYRDGDTGEHVERMSSYAQVIARQMGMAPEESALIKLAAPMHDVGKIGIRDSILLKQGRLTPEEWEQMKEHPSIGAKILAGSRSKLLQMAETIAASHHEKWDGSGYPRQLKGEWIPLVGRIVALADVFDALTTPRVYKDAWSVDDAVSHIQRERGKHFDPAVVAAFEQCLDRLLEIRSRYLDAQAN